MNIETLILGLQKDQDYLQLEKYEKQFKKYIKERAKVNDVDAVVYATHKLGLLLKYKPYGVKCASVLGYSIFLLNPGEGFSFQQHLNFKTELFHFIHVPNDGYAFIAESDDFKNINIQHSIENWWEGKHNEFDKFKLNPEPGSIVRVSRTGVVHTAIGCVLEEYANTSIDMVQRLFDQNMGREVHIMNRADVLAELRALVMPFPKVELIQTSNSVNTEPVVVKEVGAGVQEYLLHNNTDFYASRINIVNGSFRLGTDENFVSLYTSQGGLQITSKQHSIVLELAQAETVILPPNTEWIISAQANTDISVLKIHKDKAFYG